MIYWAYPAYWRIPNQLGPWHIDHRLAEGMGWHFFIMWLFALNGLIYGTYLMVSGEWRQLVPQKSDLKHSWSYILYDLRLRKTAPPQDGKFNPPQKISYFMVIIMGLGSLITGLAILKPVQLGWLTFILGGYQAARFEHFILMVGFLIFVVIHLMQVARGGWNNFRAMVAGYEIVQENQNEE